MLLQKLMKGTELINELTKLEMILLKHVNLNM